MSKSKRNPKRKNITIADIRSKYTKEKRNFDRSGIWGYYVYRPVSFYLSWIFLKIGISANIVTLISLVIGLVGCLLISTGGYINIVTGAFLIAIWGLLDHVDGNIARYKDSCSNYGEFLDAFVGYSIAIFSFISIGFAIYNGYPNPKFLIFEDFVSLQTTKIVFLLLGFWISIAIAWQGLLFNKFKLIAHAPMELSLTPKPSNRVMNLLYAVGYNLNNLTGLFIPLLIAMSILNMLHFFIFLYSITFTISLILIMYKCISYFKNVLPLEESK